jgi:hypothetical protein
MKARYLTITLVSLALFPASLSGDTESSNWTRVTASTTDGTAYHGDRYAKSIPAETSGTKRQDAHLP